MSATYKYYKCIHCKKIAKEKRKFDELEFGVPFYKCIRCGGPNYDPDILEAALLSPDVFINANKRRYNTGILLTAYFGVFAFFVISLLMEGFHWGAILAGVPIICLIVFLLIKRSRERADGYENEIQSSLIRLRRDPVYIAAVIRLQGIGKDSAWERETSKNN